MITDINRKEYIVNGYNFKNYTTLTLEEKKMVMEWRNAESIRKWMYNQDTISLDSHLKFIEDLSNREDRYYWLVTSPQGDPIGSFYIVDVDRYNDKAEFGLYMRPDSKVFGFDFVRSCYAFYFDTLDFNNIYCAVDARNKDALSMDMFMGCKFSEKKVENGITYLVSTNLDKSMFKKRYQLKFRDYLSFCRTIL